MGQKLKENENKNSEFLEIAGCILMIIMGFLLFFGGLFLYLFWDVAIGPPLIHPFIAVLVGLLLLIVGLVFLKKERQIKRR